MSLNVLTEFLRIVVSNSKKIKCTIRFKRLSRCSFISYGINTKRYLETTFPNKFHDGLIITVHVSTAATYEPIVFYNRPKPQSRSFILSIYFIFFVKIAYAETLQKSLVSIRTTGTHMINQH